MGSVETKVEISYDKNNSVLVEKVSDGYNTRIVKIPAIELDRIYLSDKDWKNIKDNKSKEFDFCLIDKYNTINECIGLFTNTSSDYVFSLDQYRIEYGSECYSLKYRPGICIDPKHKKILDEEYLESVKGYKCKIAYQDYNYNVKDILRCCYDDDKRSCNANLINNYTTNHCNGAMVQICKDDKMGSMNCIKWLEQSYSRFNNEALELYSNWCSDNFDSIYCDYFCKIARDNNDYRSEFCDSALKKWCNKNQNHEKCLCVNTPNSIIPNIEEYLGPKECWLSQCSSEPNNKWLTTDQLNIRKKCAVTNCVINIDQLTLNDNASVKFINDCVSGGSSSININQNFQKSNVEYKKKPIIGFIPELLFTNLMLILIFISNKKI